MRAISGSFTYLLFGAVLACSGGSDNSSGADGGGVSSDGSAGKGIRADGGVGGATGGPDDGSVNGDGGTSADGGPGAVAGDGGADGGAGTALDPTLPTPSHDCRTDTSTNCISIAGTYNGVPIDVFCNAPNDLSVIVHAGKWVIGCDHLNPGFARLYVPIQMPGGFAETATPASKPQVGEGTGMLFEFSADTSTSIELYIDNFVRADLAGTIVVGSAPSRSVSGTFHGDWATPGSSCSGLSGGPCAAADLNVTFRIQTRYGSCFSAADCTAPQMCDSVSYLCR
jgi:hypothetical protein